MSHVVHAKEEELAMKRGSTLNLLKRNLTSDRIGDKHDVEENPDSLFTNRTDIKS